MFLYKMILWKPDKITEDFGNYLANRLGLPKDAKRIKDGLADIDFLEKINLEIRFVNGDGKKLVIDILPFKRKLDGLGDYLKKQVETELIFSNSGTLQTIGRRREFGKYSDRLKYFGATEEKGQEGIEKVSVTYEVKESLLSLNHSSFRETVFDYALAPLLDWIQRKT